MDDFTTRKNLDSLGAIYRWDGTAQKPHCILTSGRHSPFFINGTKLLEDPAAIRKAAVMLVEMYDLKQRIARHHGSEHHPRVRFVGQAMGSIVLASYLAEECGALTAFSEKRPDGWMEMARFSPSENEILIIVEDVLTTGETSRKTRADLRAKDLTLDRIVLCVANRSGSDTIVFDDQVYEIKALVTMPAESYTPDECPACKLGSAAHKPKAVWESLFVTK